MANTPTIIIGIGTSGLYVLENMQRFYYETYKENKPDNVEYLYIETNEDNKPVGTPKGNSINRVYIGLDNMEDMIKEIKISCNDPEWLPSSREILSAGLGAGGIRSCGRLALWGRNQKGDNFNNVISAITRAYSNVMHISNNQESTSSKPAVFITGSLTGGTGAGTFIDMGYLIRDLIPEIKDLYGLFLLPNEPRVMRGNEVMYGNAYGAAQDLEHYCNENNTYVERWPSGSNQNFEMPPYELVQFISQDYQDGAPAISSLTGLYKMAGLYLFLNVAGIYEKRRERLVDAKGNSLIGHFGTFGLSAIQFPKDSIQEYVSSTLSIELLQRYTDDAEYYLNGQQRPISRATIKQRMTVAFDGILENAFANLNIVDDKDLMVSLEKEAVKINRGEIKGSAEDYIISLFASTRGDQFHALVSNNVRSAQNVFIDGIYELVDNALQTTQNLYYARHVLEDITESINRTLKFWKSIGMSSKHQNWDNKLRDLTGNCVRNTYKMVFEQDSVLKDRLATILELMKMHIVIPTLIDIMRHVKEGRIKLEGTNHELPKLSFFDNLIRKLNAMIGKNDGLDTATITFHRTLKNIEADVSDTTLPILRVYPSNSFEKECEKARQVYSQKSGNKVPSMADVIQEENILNYFKEKLQGNFTNGIYLDLLKAYRLKTDSFNCIEDFNIANYIKNHATESVRTAGRATSPFLKIKKTLSPSQYLPRFVVGDDSNDISNIISTLESTNFHEFENSKNGIKELPDLKNIVVFFDEKGNYTLRQNLSYINEMKEAFENVPKDLADDSVTNERWKKNRSAYTTN